MNITQNLAANKIEYEKEHNAAFRKSNPNYLKNWRAANPDKVKEYTRKNNERRRLKEAEGHRVADVNKALEWFEENKAKIEERRKLRKLN